MRSRVLAAAAVAALAIAPVAAGCGSDDGGNGNGGSGEASAGAENTQFQEAAQAVEDAKAIPAFTLDAPPVDAAKAKGMSMHIIPISSEIPFIQGVSETLKGLAERLGMKATIFANQGQPTQWAQGIDQAISQQADVVVLVSAPDPELLIPQLQRAKKAGVKVIVGHLYATGEQPPANVRDLITAITTAPFHEAARLEVDQAVAETEGDTNALIVTSRDIVPSDGIVAAMQDQFDKRCSSCKVTVVNVPTTEWGTKIRPEVQSALTKDPTINWVIPLYDSMSLAVQSGITAAGRQGDVRIVSFNGTPEILKLIQDGDVMFADVGESLDWLAWSMMDQSLRVLTGMEPTKDGNEQTPLRLFDSSNVDEAGVPPTTDKGYGDAYVEGYEQLWGLR